MNDDTVFLVTEVWYKPGSFTLFQAYRKEVIALLENYHPEYIHYNHPFQWVYNPDGQDFPTGMEIMKFRNIELAREAINALNDPVLKTKEKDIFSKVRSYLSKFAPPEFILKERGLK